MPIDHGDPIDREEGEYGYPCDTEWDKYNPLGDHYSSDESNYYYLDPADPEYRDPSDPAYTAQTGYPSNRRKGYCWKICPYSTEWATRSPDILAGQGSYRTQVKQGSTITYQFIKVLQSEQTNHTRTNGRMRFQMRGTITGWVCDDLACYHYTTEDPGKKFFLI